MYNLTKKDGYQYSGNELPYVLDIIPVSNGLAAIASDQSLALFDPSRLSKGPQHKITTNHGNISSGRAYDASSSMICTAGANGSISLWDFRLMGSRTQVARPSGCNAPILSVACSAASQSIAAGTELADRQASIMIWDMRNPSKPRVEYHELHSDDVTELNFHPTESHVLLSGSTDGLINICDTSIVDEDEVIVQAFNHGSIHHAGYLNDCEIWALSHDEKFVLYDLAAEGESDRATCDFGDVRTALNCQYAANVTSKTTGNAAVVGTGAQDRQFFQLVHMSKAGSGPWAFGEATSVGLPGAHGNELVRSFCFFDQEQTVFTAGEDGQILSWRPR